MLPSCRIECVGEEADLNITYGRINAGELPAHRPIRAKILLEDVKVISVLFLLWEHV